MASASSIDVLAISSSGGHWRELSCLFAALDGLSVAFACTDGSRAAEVPAGTFHVLTHANRTMPWRLIVCAAEVLAVVVRLRPKVVLTTGAAPGLLAVALGKMIGARCIWVETVACVERMTLSGRLAKPFADEYLVQWPHLAKRDGPHYHGSLL